MFDSLKYLQRQTEYPRLNFTNRDDTRIFCPQYYYNIFIFNEPMEP